MKKCILLLCFITTVSICEAQRQKTFGFRGGTQFTQVSNANLDTKTGFYLGLFGNFKLSEFYALQPELGYALHGGESDLMSEANIDLHYISLSVANKFFVKNSGFHFIVAPGLYFDTDDTLVGLANRTEGNNVSFIDVTLGLGVGYVLNNGLGFEARYIQGAVDVFSGTFNSFESEQLDYETQLNSGIQLGLFYQFNF
ncbi:outer membrane beta-barrel protein [Pseudotamlana agarivorans]|uniref:outer membrane beta-barrel protein n=1 Tax=Pseudotamlana agarivorans TaxID=481183 RepID=UPI0008320F5F|nr:outer membrane beta-barrel protein [Tamlana agarivorans]